MESSKYPPVAQSKRNIRRVSFAEDTKFDASRDSHAYLRSRRNPDYEPGTFSISSARGLWDTSFFADPYFNCNQLKVFVGTPQEFEDLLGTYEMPSRNEGIMENHPHCNEIVACLDELYEDDDGRLARDVKGADWILVSVEDGEIVEVMLHDTWEVEDLDSFNDAIENCNPSGGDQRDLTSLMDRSAVSARPELSAPMQHRSALETSKMSEETIENGNRAAQAFPRSAVIDSNVKPALT